MVFKRPTNSRDDRNGRSGKPSKRDDNKRSSSSRANSSKSTERPSNDNSQKRYSSGPAAERSSFSTGAEKKSYGPRKPYSGRPTGDDEKPKRSYGGDSSGDKKAFTPRNKPYSGRPTGSEDDRPKRSPDSYRGGGDAGGKKDFAPRNKPYSGRPTADNDRPKRTYGGDSSTDKRDFTPRNKPYSGMNSGDDSPKRNFESKRGFTDKPAGDRKFAGSKPATGGFKRDGDKPFRKTGDKPVYDKITRDRDAPVKTLRPKKPAAPKEDGLIRLNRYIANAGICSRRKADELIVAGVVSVNGEVVNELGLKVDPFKDEIRYNGETLKREKNVYVLLNKPKDYITTTEDPQERRTVMHLVEKASRERIYPVGRLDRNTTGLLLMTNDGDLADKLSHPRSNITKLYQVELSKSLSQGDLNKIQFGVELEDGLIKPDSVSYVQGGTKREVGIQIHSGKNRVVRRIFEHLGYEVVKLDRVVYANLTKKDLPRGRWRFLDEKEIIQLKHLIK